jgi:YVTN family beta-propeller protein
MKWIRGFLACLVLAGGALAATFGTVVPTVGGLLDIVLDEGRNRLYLVNPSYNRIEVYAIAQRRFLTPVAVDRLPISAALSRSGKYLYVTCFDGSSLNVIDLDTMTVSRRVSLPAKPEGVAVGADERVLITTIGTGPNNQAILS